MGEGLGWPQPPAPMPMGRPIVGVAVGGVDTMGELDHSVRLVP
jgi:hypothetical protein